MKIHYINGPGLGPLCLHPRAQKISPNWQTVTCLRCLKHVANLHRMYLAMGETSSFYDGAQERLERLRQERGG